MIQNKQNTYPTSLSNHLKYVVLSVICSSFVVFGIALDHPLTILKGLYNIVVCSDILITDYIAVGGLGAAFFNSGILMLVSIFILYRLKIDMNGISIAAIFLMGSFGLFGKNIFNVWLIILGVFLYAKVKRHTMKEYIHIAFFATSMAPVVTEFMFVLPLPIFVRVPLACMIGLSIGFFLPPLAAHMYHIHKGFNLYNIGFTVGILGTVFVSIFKSYGYETNSNLIWSSNNNLLLGIFLSLLFLSMIMSGFLFSGKSFTGYLKLLRHSGQGSRDFVELEGFGSVLINMGLNGFLASGYILLVGGPLNGPTVGGILTVVGFGAFGKHIRNIIPILVGVLVGGFTKVWGINEPPVLLASMFGTALAPISGHYGWVWGVAAGFINSSVALNSGILHGGMNLYNTGFSAGIVAAVMVPLLETFSRNGTKKAKNEVGS